MAGRIDCIKILQLSKAKQIETEEDSSNGKIQTFFILPPANRDREASHL